MKRVPWAILPQGDPLMVAMLKREILIIRQIAIAAAICLAISPVQAQSADPLEQWGHGPQRSDKNTARDQYRHPREVIAFFGIQPDSHVVEILPGSGGYWTEILAPYLKERGLYIAANGEKSSTSTETIQDNAGFQAKITAHPELYGKVEISEFAADKHDIAASGSADFVITFRNIHNWMSRGETDAAFKTFFKALKPGGVLGIEEHRGKPDEPQDPLAKSGYVRQDVAIHFAEAAGFKFVGSSEINANPKDTKDYSVGVWALPPVFRLKEQDHDKYAAIGESDRFILKFIKPVQ
eukprot:gene13182-13286_t